jgi:uncharacterized protein YndB with AHSA1/START domain
MPKTNLQQQIFIDALPRKVWKVLTGSYYVNQYLFNGTVQCQWTEESQVTLTRQLEGKTETTHAGRILQATPGVLLKYNLQEEVTACLITITYELIPAENGIELKFQCEGFTGPDEEYFFRIKESKLLLQKIKWLAEYA